MKRSAQCALLVASLLWAHAATAQSCSQVFFSQQPGWTNHAEWSGSDLLVTDRLRGSVLAFKKDGRPTPSGLTDLEEALSPYSYDLLALQRAGSDWLMQMAPSRFIRLGGQVDSAAILDLENLEVRLGTLNAQEELDAQKARLRRIHEWTLAGDYLALIGDLTTLAEPSKAELNFAGVVRVDLRDPTNAVLLGEPWPFNSATWRRHRVIQPTLAASASGDIFFLRLDDTPRIYHHNPDTNASDLVPLDRSTPEHLGASTPPEIPDVGLQKLTLIMTEVENTPFVAGLYIWEEQLYVLHREPNRAQTTTWSLIKVDPSTGNTLGHRSTLPTHANHLVVAPGDTWAFVEKGPYLGFGNQRIPSVYFIEGQVVQDFKPKLCPDGR